ncbi:MAG: LysM peptidoglycan-binding domain-containing protein [Phycisphaerae bacterium]
MRTDVKIGIAVSVFVLLVVVVYLVVFKHPKPDDKVAQTTPTPTNSVAPTATPRTTRTPTRPPTATPTPLATPSPTAPPLPTIDVSSTPAPTATPSPLPTIVVIPITPAPSPTPAGAGEERKYVVLAGDNFHSIAQKMYGSSQYWDLIAKANPASNANALRVGQTLIVPPLPKVSPTPTPPGGAPPLPAGAKEYVVKEGDGFWRIAEAMYGNGSLWPTVAKANPGVTNDSLKPGMKLVIPPKPTPLSTTRPGGTGPIAAVDYTVVAGDTLHSIARKHYGDDKYWTTIMAANGLTSDTLQAGTTLHLPAIEGARAPTTRPVRGGTSPTAAPTRAPRVTPRATIEPDRPDMSGGPT